MTAAKKTRVSIDDDFLSKLPDQILDRILCLLPQKESVRTCVLSKPWRHLGPCRSKLELCHVDDFNSDGEKFLSVVHNTLQRYNHQNLFLKQLSLKTTFSSDPPLRLDLPFVESLEELYLERLNWNHINLLFKHLRKLSLSSVKATEENLETMLSSTCPLIECFIIRFSSGFKNLNIRNARYLMHVEVWHNSLSSIEFDVPTLETITICDYSLRRCFLDNHYFPRLKSLCLTIGALSSRTFDFFDSNHMPSLEKLELDHCYGCKEVELSSSSIKYLSIINVSHTTKFTIDAPNITCFNLIKKFHPLSSLSFTPISSEYWKSHLGLRFTNNYSDIHRVLKSLSGSKIALKLFIDKEYQRRIVDAAYHVLYKKKPLVVEHLVLELGDYSYSTDQFMFEYLFRICRPRYIYDVHIQDMSEEGITVKIVPKFLLHEREKMGYSWDRDLLEVSVESSYYDYPKDLLECDHQKLRYRLKWRDS